MTREDGDVVVVMDVSVEIKLLFLNLLRLDTRGREVWRDGHLVAFDSRTIEDGHKISVSVRARGNGFVIRGPNGRLETVDAVAPAHPWHSAVLASPFLLDPVSGTLNRVRVTSAGREVSRVLGRDMITRKHVISGDIDAEVWTAADGTWVRMEFFKAGSLVTLALSSISPPQSFTVSVLGTKTTNTRTLMRNGALRQVKVMPAPGIVD